MKTRSLILILSLICLNFFAQKKNIDTVYVRYDNSIDRHYNKKGKVNYFDICINNKLYKRFQYGSSNNIKKVINFNKKLTTRKELYKIIENDSPNKNFVFFIVKNQNGQYYLYPVDYIFRTIKD